MDAKHQQALIAYAVAAWDFPADVAQSLSEIIERKEREKVMVCTLCKDTGKVWDTTADAENGPSSHPGDDMMFERPCEDCEIGLALMHAENEANDKANREFFARLAAGDPEAIRQEKEAWEGPDEEAAWERHTEFSNR